MTKRKPAKTSTAPSWEFNADIPTFDFLEEATLEDGFDLQEAVQDFLFWLEEKSFLTWEAVACKEQGISLTREQKKALDSLLNFNDEADDRIRYINESPRPSEPWHVILNKIAPHLLIEPFRTFDSLDEAQCDGWPDIVSALREHGRGLSLPPGVENPEEVVPAETRHKLWLQSCFDGLSGLGQEEDLTLDNPDQQDRIEWFIEHLRERRESLAFFGLTLDSLLARVVLPDKDRPIFVAMMQEKLGLPSTREQIAGYL